MSARWWNDNINLSTSTSTNTSYVVNTDFTKCISSTTRCHSSRYNLTTVNNDRNTTTSSITVDRYVIIGTIVVTRPSCVNNNSIDFTCDCIGLNCSICEYWHVVVREKLKNACNWNSVHVLPTIPIASSNDASASTSRLDSARLTIWIGRRSSIVDTFVNLILGVHDIEVGII